MALVYNHSRESLAIGVGQRLTGGDVVRVLEQVTSQRGKRREEQGGKEGEEWFHGKNTGTAHFAIRMVSPGTQSFWNRVQ